MIVPGLECRLCRGPIFHYTGRKGGVRHREVCDTCDRQRCRVPDILSACCGALQVFRVAGRFCPACPGPGKVAVAFVAPDGREREVFWPRDTRIANYLTLEGYARRLGLEPDALVLYARDARAWGLGWPRVTRFQARAAKKAKRRGSRSTASLRAREAKRTRDRLRHRLKVPCASCGQVKTPYVVSHPWCAACAQLAQRNGVCARHGCGREGQPRRRSCAGPYCPETGCAPPAARLRRCASVSVTVTDGREVREVLLERCTRIGGHHADAWVAPLVLVDRLRLARVDVRGGVVVGGVLAPWTGASSRMALAELARRLPDGRGSPGQVADVMRDAFGLGWAGYLRGLRRALLLDDDGLTDRGRALLRWAASAGVRF